MGAWVRGVGGREKGTAVAGVGGELGRDERGE